MIWSALLVYYLMSGTSSVVNDTRAYGFQLPATAIGSQQIGRETYFPFKRQTLKRIKRNDNLDTSLETKIDKAVSREAKDFAKSHQKVIRPVLRAKIKAELVRDEAVQAKGTLTVKVVKLEKDLEISKKKILDFKSILWKVAARVYLDDIQAEFKPRYDKYMAERVSNETAHKEAHNKLQVPRGSQKPPYVTLYPTPHDNPDGCDPKAVRVRQKANFFDWLTVHEADDEDVKIILEKMEETYRSIQEPPIPEESVLTEEQKKGFEKFRKKSCKAAGLASEYASFTVHGDVAQKLIKGELKKLNIYGPRVDPYLLPLLNALVPMSDAGLEPVEFVEEQE